MTAPMTEEQERQKTLERGRQYNKAFFKRMTEEERKQFFKDRYQKYKKAHNARGKEWATKNREKAQASAHQAFVKKRYPTAFSEGDITLPDLIVWLQANRGSPCTYCKDPATHIDHKVPLGKGGPHKWENIQILCESCNYAKHDSIEKDFIDHIKKIIDQMGN